MADRVYRVTMFKIPKPEDRQKLIEQYEVVNQNNVKVRSMYNIGAVTKQAKGSRTANPTSCRST